MFGRLPVRLSCYLCRMKNIKFSLLFFLFMGIVFASCKKDEPEVINADDFTASTGAMLRDGNVLGTINASTNKGTLTYTLASQSIAGAITVNASTGQIVVADSDNFYEVYCRLNSVKTFTAEVFISNGSISKTIKVTIELKMEDCKG